MKAMHYVVVLVIIFLVVTQQTDTYDMYGQQGSRVTDFEYGDIVRVYIKDQKMIQVVDTDAYNEHLIFYVVMEAGMITEFDVISHQETEDYGGYITEEWFKERLLLSCNQPLEVVKLSKKADHEVVAVTGATITTDSIVYGINNCIMNYWRYLNEV